MEMDSTPPYSEPTTPTPVPNTSLPPPHPDSNPTTSPLNPTLPQRPPNPITIHKPFPSSPHRLQHDLLLLTSFNDNTTLHWRPSWFPQTPFAASFWTLHNPPNVVTESLPQVGRGRRYYTRRMRRVGDPPPVYIKTGEAWDRYCGLYGVPRGFLGPEMVLLAREGACDLQGRFVAPPSYPLYPEPQPLGHGRYILDPSTYHTHLPVKFHSVNHAPSATHEAQVVVVHSTGALTIEPRAPFFMHASQWTHFNGRGGYEVDALQNFEEGAPRQQGPGRRWSYLPWTEEQAESCRMELLVRLRVGGWERPMGDGLLRAMKAEEEWVE
ncbi:hypothetical protein LEMA_P118240.1 [Plenodomus lingam JN3]|uniref:Uncharacterized protein n=2 Tax=Leptosphaeria maculans TaxID=5022 RepID=E4ZTG5_LEPMJ|nr:hypothetical protein LEMA_P118240.1 [Plenodomus lingam JN3]CBX94821.1 hypothetical protein LEMA_P118240.1 [Plenodomus lingam JN3]